MKERPRTFHLHRHVDLSGVSGIGIVAYGVQFPDGLTVIRWLGARPSTVTWDGVEDAEAIHSHDGATSFVWH